MSVVKQSTRDDERVPVRQILQQRGSSRSGTAFGTSSDCGCVKRSSGGVTLGGLEWPVALITSTGVELVYQGDDGGGDHTWESDIITESCSDGQGGTVTDDYQYILTVLGGSNAAGQVKLIKSMETGGGDGGISACCPDREAGYQWSYFNAWEIDPLVTFVMKRKANEIEARLCSDGPCEMCLAPSSGPNHAACECIPANTLPAGYTVSMTGWSSHPIDPDPSPCGCQFMDGSHVVTHRLAADAVHGSTFYDCAFIKDTGHSSGGSGICSFFDYVRLSFVCDPVAADPGSYSMVVSVSSLSTSDGPFQWIKTWDNISIEDWIEIITSPGRSIGLDVIPNVNGWFCIPPNTINVTVS